MKSLFNEDGTSFFCTVLENIHCDAKGLKSATTFDSPLKLAFPGSMTDAFQFGHGYSMQQLIGTLETESLNNSVCIIAETDRDKNLQAIDELHVFNSVVLNFAQYLWGDRDNCVNIDTGFMLERHGGALMAHKRNIRSFFFDAEGQGDKIVKFSLSELRRAADAAFLSWVNAKKSGRSGFEKKPTSRTKGLIRRDRFWLWIIDARRQDDLLARVSLYITAIEALLATSTSELSHQLSERVAVFLPGLSKSERLDCFNVVKRCYGIRSKGLHGAVLKQNDEKDLNELSSYLDDICRKFWLLSGGENDFSKSLTSDEKLDDLFKRELFR